MVTSWVDLIFFNDGFSGVTGVPDSMFMVIRQVPRICHVLVSIMEKDASVMVTAGLKRVKKSSPGVYRSSSPARIAAGVSSCWWKFPSWSNEIFPAWSALTVHVCCGKNRLSFKAVQPVVSTLTRELKRQSRLESDVSPVIFNEERLLLHSWTDSRLLLEVRFRERIPVPIQISSVSSGFLLRSSSVIWGRSVHLRLFSPVK